MFELPENAVSLISQYASDVVADIGPIWTLLLGILLAWSIAEALLSMFRLPGRIRDIDDEIDREESLRNREWIDETWPYDD